MRPLRCPIPRFAPFTAVASWRRAAARARSASLRPRAGALVLVLLGLLALPRPAAADVNQAKANMLWNIAKFVEWPGLQLDPKTPLIFTILGEDDLAAELAGVLSSKMVNGRPVFVRFARRPQDAKGSQILYVAATEVPRMTDVLAVVDTLPVLTVSDAPGFATHGGMLGFTQTGEKVRFEVNLSHAERTGLKLSAKLLALARLVSDSPGTP